MEYNEPITVETIAANQRHDREHPGYTAQQSVWTPQQGRIGSAWKPAQLVRRGKLTDKKIAEYERLGYYSPEFKEARRALQDKKRVRHQRRDGNFVIGDDGRMTYSPL